ncbi:MAG: M50 family metallopeptidase [Bacilli bacterium]|nr:M50 family metallopeptidase [Bacilli bacterium]MDD4796094.1 M50 family metallopeptidase [Bacilli bacterium]
MTLIILILILGVLIFVHELGHFIFAKKTGVHVYEFALGMGPKIFSYQRKPEKKDPTIYSLRIFPIGGFCAMAGEVSEDDDEIKPNEFMCNKTKFQKFLILIAGVSFNFLLALVLLFFQSLIWGNVEQKPIIGYAPADYPISDSGIEEGDKVIELNGHKINTWDKLTIVLNLKYDKDIYYFKIEKKDGTIKRYEITPKLETNEDGDEIKVFGLGVGDNVQTGFINAIKYAFTKFGSIVSTMAMIIASLFTGKLGLSSLSGPVGMYTIVGETAKYGLQSIVYLTAYLSVNLGFINAIPFPAFDGGRILFILIEAITKKKVNVKIEGMLHTIGFVLLMILMLYITALDIWRLF